MKKLLFLLLLSVANLMSLQSQVTVSEKSLNLYKQVATETVYVQINSSILFVGEQLLYKTYVLNIENQASISKIAYVALVDRDQQIIFKQKIRLNPSTGSGDFTIPYNLASGTYQLVVYTQWMRNSGPTNYFHTPIYIINPFVASKSRVQVVESLDENKNTINLNKNLIELTTNNSLPEKRKKVQLTIKSLAENNAYGNYSVSVRKIDPLRTLNPSSIGNYRQLFQNNSRNFQPAGKDYQMYPPELKGDLITGYIVNNRTNKPISDIKVALSIPSNDFIFKTTKTNEFGVFYFDLENNYDGDQAYLQVFDANRERYSIIVNAYPKFKFEELDFSPIKISRDQKDWISEKIEKLQIENAYYTVKKDSLVPLETIPSFYKPDYIYNLDDFTLFKTVQETMVEIIEHSWVTNKKGKHYFHVRDYKSSKKNDVLPLILIDGVLIQDPDVLFYFDIKKIKSIGIITDRFLFNSDIYGGVILVKTRNLDYNPQINNDYSKTLTLEKPTSKKIYFQPNYSKASLFYKRIPDERTQLIWLPNLNFTTPNTTLEFFTSDNIGEYEIKLEGFTFTGKPVLVTKTITVK
jgi:hypothetical protein